MIMRKIGFVGLAGFLALSLTTVAEAKQHHSRHHHHYVRHAHHHAHFSHARYHRHHVRFARHHTHIARHHVASAGGGASGIASVYASGGDGYAGRRSASGERVSSGALTAAHRTLPFGTLVRVTNSRSGRSVVVRINDRGPFVHGRVIDLTPAGARAIGMSGLAPVSLSVIGRS
jgi:rare lipoprotein A